jgi:phage FluMu protein Com
MEKITCSHCGRWIARVEKSNVIIPCPRCKHEEKVPIPDLIELYEYHLSELKRLSVYLENRQIDRDRLSEVMTEIRSNELPKAFG